MAYELKDNSGSLFRNDRPTGDSAPSHTGKLLIEGKLYRLAAWTRESNSGTRYFSLSVEPYTAGIPNTSIPGVASTSIPDTQPDYTALLGGIDV
jgi:hypothetical protein